MFALGLMYLFYVLLQREVLEYKRVDEDYVTGLQEKWVNCGLVCRW